MHLQVVEDKTLIMQDLVAGGQPPFGAEAVSMGW